MVAVGLVIAAGVVGKPTNDDLTIPGSDSTQATDLLDAKLPNQANGTVPIALKATEGSARPGSRTRRPSRRPFRTTRRIREVRSVDQPLQRRGRRPPHQGRGYRLHLADPQRRPGRRSTRTRPSELIALADPAEKAGIEVAAGAYLGQEVSKPGTESSEVDRPRRGDHRAALRLRDRGRDAAADRHRDLRALGRPQPDRPARPRRSRSRRSPRRSGRCSASASASTTRSSSSPATAASSPRATTCEEAAARATATSGGAVLFAGSTVVIALLSLYFGGHPDRPRARLLGGDRRRRRGRRGAHPAAGDARPARRADQLAEAALRGPSPRRPAARLGALGARGRPPPVARGDRRDRRSCSRSRCRCSTSRSASPTTASFPKDTADQAVLRHAHRRASAPARTARCSSRSSSIRPAKPDTKKLNQVEAKQQKQQQQAQQQYEQQAQEAAARRRAAAARAGRADAEQQQEQQAAEAVPQVDRERPAPGQAQQPDRARTHDVDYGLASRGQQATATPRSSASPRTPRRSRERHGRPRQPSSATTSSPTALGYRAATKAYVGGSTAAYIDLADRIGEKLPLVIAIVVGAQLPAADGRLPLARRAADRRADEPDLGRRLLRRPRRRLREGLRDLR